MKISAALLEQLSTSRFITTGAQPSVGVGERRSKAKGAGLEFAEHRPYYAGDDVKHLDARLLARLGENYIRQYSVDRQLPITIVLDASASMHYGEPDKYVFAQSLAQGLSFVGLAGGDRVQMAVASAGTLHWSPRLHGANRAEILVGWLARFKPQGQDSFKGALSQVRSVVPRGGLLLLISDWWVEDFSRELGALAVDRQEIIGFHVVAPQESDPEMLGSGPHFLIDIETGEEAEIQLNPDTVERYRRAFAGWGEDLRSIFARHQSRYIQIGTSADLPTVFLRRLRGAGVIS